MLCCVQVNVPASLMVDFHGAQGKLAASVVAPSGAEQQAVIQQVDNGTLIFFLYLH